MARCRHQHRNGDGDGDGDGDAEDGDRIDEQADHLVTALQRGEVDAAGTGDRATGFGVVRHVGIVTDGGRAEVVALDQPVQAEWSQIGGR